MLTPRQFFLDKDLGVKYVKILKKIRGPLGMLYNHRCKTGGGKAEVPQAELLRGGGEVPPP